MITCHYSQNQPEKICQNNMSIYVDFRHRQRNQLIYVYTYFEGLAFEIDVRPLGFIKLQEKCRDGWYMYIAQTLGVIIILCYKL